MEDPHVQPEPRLVIRPLTPDDYEAVVEIHKRSWEHVGSWKRDAFTHMVTTFPDGQIGVELDGELAAVSASLILFWDQLDPNHTYDEACQDGWIKRHRENGDMLYGFDIVVDPAHRGKRLARRIYEARKELVVARNLRGIVVGGRIPKYHEHAQSMTASEYVAKVLRRELRDPVVSTQRANGFVARRILPKYLPSDKASCGYAVLMEWQNPEWVPSTEEARPNAVRVSSVQYKMRSLESFSDFAEQCEFFIDTASEYRCDFVLFPELLTNQLLALVRAKHPEESARELHRFTNEYEAFFSKAAIQYNVNIIGGTHLTVEDERLYNIAYLFHRDGRIDKQYKIHITPSEARWWGVLPGEDIHVFDTDRGKVAIAICYDVEFPEYSRIAKEEGAELLFVPYNTDIRSGHLRVRVCAQARAIENHMYVITAGAVGNLPQVEGADIHYAQSAILTPSDIAFPRDAIAAEATPNVETMLVQDLDLLALRRMEEGGAVRTWQDRRTDLYQVARKPKVVAP